MEEEDWEIPAQAQPRQEHVAFDLSATLSGVVGVRSEIPEDAFTASILGTERIGNGIVIDNTGLVVTIGYLITEADTIWITTNRNTAAPGHVIGYDQSTGFGLVQALGRLNVPAIPIGSSQDVSIGESVIVAGSGGKSGALNATIAGKREFAGYWEYLLDEAIFTAPAHPHWGGAACLDKDGNLVGVGSLLIQGQTEDGEETTSGNMIVPIDLLGPILDELKTLGRSSKPPRPWLGIYPTETESGILLAGLARNGPAHEAGAVVGDIVTAVDGDPVDELADLYRKVWARGHAGCKVPLTIQRKGETLQLDVKSIDRSDLLKKPSLH